MKKRNLGRRFTAVALSLCMTVSNMSMHISAEDVSFNGADAVQELLEEEMVAEEAAGQSDEITAEEAVGVSNEITAEEVGPEADESLVDAEELVNVENLLEDPDQEDLTEADTEEEFSEDHDGAQAAAEIELDSQSEPAQAAAETDLDSQAEPAQAAAESDLDNQAEPAQAAAETEPDSQAEPAQAAAESEPETQDEPVEAITEEYELEEEVLEEELPAGESISSESPYIFEVKDPMLQTDGITCVLNDNALSTDETGKTTISCRGVDLSEIEQVSFDLLVKAGSAFEEEAAQELIITFPDNMTLSVEKKDPNQESYELDVQNTSAALRFSQPVSANADDVLAQLTVTAVPVLSECKVLEENEAVVGTQAGEQAFETVKLLFDPYAVVGTVDQTGSEYVITEGQGAVFHVDLGADTPYVSLDGYKAFSRIDQDLFDVYAVRNEEGEDLTWTAQEDGTLQIEIPEGAVTPYSYSLYLVCKEKISTGNPVEVSHTAFLEHETLPCGADIQWSKELTQTIVGRELLLSWQEYLDKRMAEYDLTLVTPEQEKLLYRSIYQDYKEYKANYLKALAEQLGEQDDLTFLTDEVTDLYAGGMFGNNYIEVYVDSDGRYTMGNVEGDPKYASDNNQILLYGHPEPGTTETLIGIDGSEYFFSADQVTVGSGSARAVMHIPDKNVIVYQDLMLVSSGNTAYNDCVKISYEIVNNNTFYISVGVRIMLDTMLANNDDAPFKIPGYGNLTTIKTFTGSSIPKYYQVYDNLDTPTTLATGYLIVKGERAPDKVQFTHWSDVNDASWDYTAADGNDLGDSAVSIYFNPHSAAPRKSITVSTRYGAGLFAGASNGSVGSHTIKSSEVGLQIVDNAKNTPVENVTVEVSTDSKISSKSDSTGMAVLKLSDIKGKELKIYKDGYQTEYLTRGWTGGSTYTVSLKSLADTAPKITAVTLDGKDLLKQTVKFTEDSSGVIDKPDNASRVYNIRINASSDSDNSVYYLMQEEELVAKSRDGSFQLSAMKGAHDANPYISSLDAGKRYYIKCVGPDGKKSIRRIGLEVVKPTLSFEAGDLTKAVLSLGGGSGEAGNLLLKALAQGNDFNIDAGPVSKFSVSVDPDKQSVKIGINVKPELLNGSNETAYREFKETIHSISKKSKMSKADKKYYENTVKRWQDSKKKFKVASFSGGVTCAGTVELAYKDGHFNGTLYFAVSGNMEGSTTYNFTVWCIPMYVTIGFDGKIELKFIGDVVCEDGSGLLDCIYQLLEDFLVDVGVSGEVGLGDGRHIKVGGKLRAGINYLHKFKSNYNEVNVNGKFSVEAKALIWEKSMTICEGKWNVYSGYANSNVNLAPDYGSEEEPQTMEEAFEMLMEQPTVMADREYLSVSDEIENPDAVMTNVYTDSQSSIITAGDKQYRFLLTDDTDRAAQNRTKLVYAVNGGDGWDTYTAVEDDGTADFGYALAADENHIYVLWQDCAQVYEDTVDIDTMCKGVDLSFAVIDITTDEVADIKTVCATSDSYEQVPALCVSGDTVYLAWNATKSAVFETTSGSSLRSAVYTEGSLTDGASLAISDGMIIENLTVQSIDGAVTAVYTMTEWNDLLEQNHQTTCKWVLGEEAAEQTGIPSSESIPLYGIVDGNTVVFTFHDGNIYYADYEDPQAVETALFEADETLDESGLPASLSSEFVVVNDSKSDTYVIWVSRLNGEVEDSEQLRYAWAVKRSGGVWSAPYMLTELSYGNIGDFSVVLDSSDVMTLSWLSTAYDENNNLLYSELVEKVLTEDDGYKDIELTSYTYDAGGAPEGETCEAVLTIKNNGTLKVDQATVEVNCGSYYETQDIALEGLDLEPGESTTRTINITIGSAEVEEYTLQVYVEDDQDMDNGLASFELGGTKLTWYQKETQIIGEEKMIPIKIINESHVSAEDVQVRIISASGDGAVLYDNIIGTVEADDSVFLYIPFDHVADMEAYLYLETSTPQREAQEAAMLYAYTQSIELKETHSLTVTAGEGGALETEYTNAAFSEGDLVTVTAYASDGYDFWKWESDQTVEMSDEWSASMEFTMPSEDTVIKAVFRPHLEPESLTVAEESVQLYVGDTQTFEAVMTPENVSIHVDWSSSDENVFTVDPSGKVTAVAAGEAVLTASCNGLEDTVQISVLDVAIEGIELVGPVYINGLGKSEDLLPVLTPVNASAKIEWTSEDPSIATVEDGVVTSVGVGNVVIKAASAADPSISAQVTVIVTVNLEGVALDTRNTSMNIGDEQIITASLLPENFVADSDVTWSTDNADAVEITTSGDFNEKATIIAKTNGIAVITAKYEDKEASCFVYVRKKIDELTLMQSEITLVEGRSFSLSYTILPSDADETIVWSSSNPDVATVSDDGQVYAGYDCAGQSATITAASESGGVSASCVVNVITNHVYADDISQLQSSHPYANGEDFYYHYTLDGASEIDVFFSDDTETESGYDYIYIYDGNDDLVARYSGTELSGKAVYVPTNAVTIWIDADDSVNDYGFRVTNVRSHQHSYGAWKQTSAPTALAAGRQERTCVGCGHKQTGTIAKLSPFVKLNVSGTLPLKVKQSTSAVKVTGLQKGDYVKSWKSSNTKIVKVNATTGKLTALKKTGTATVTVTTQAGATAKFKVKVQKAAVKTKKITVASKSITIAVKGKANLLAAVSPLTSQDKLKYKSSNKKVAAVSSKGVVTGKKKGTATITVTAGKKKAKVKVTVK